MALAVAAGAVVFESLGWYWGTDAEVDESAEERDVEFSPVPSDGAAVVELAAKTERSPRKMSPSRLFQAESPFLGAVNSVPTTSFAESALTALQSPSPTAATVAASPATTPWDEVAITDEARIDHFNGFLIFTAWAVRTDTPAHLPVMLHLCIPSTDPPLLTSSSSMFHGAASHYLAAGASRGSWRERVFTHTSTAGQWPSRSCTLSKSGASVDARVKGPCRCLPTVWRDTVVPRAVPGTYKLESCAVTLSSSPGLLAAYSPAPVSLAAT